MQIRVRAPFPLDYAKEVWSTGRMVLDTAQNHLPTDSKGNKIGVFLVLSDGNLYPLAEVPKSIDPASVSQIIFADDGIGYSYELLEYPLSTKVDDKSSAGEHGEGLKLVASAALRAGIKLEYFSRDWVAVPAFEEKVIDGQHLVRPCFFDVTTQLETIDGSRSVFYNPSPEFVNYVLLILQTNVLPLRPNYVPLCATSSGSIVENSNRIFIKGIFNTTADVLFGYDLQVPTPRDRNHVLTGVLYNEIGKILRECTDIDIIKKVVWAAITERNSYLEFKAVSNKDFSSEGSQYYAVSHLANASLWKRAFEEVVHEQSIGGKNAVIATSVIDSRVATMMGFNPIKVDPQLATFLNMVCQVPTDKSVASTSQSADTILLTDESKVPATVRVTMESASHLRTYRAEKWTGYRIFADAVSNHLDSKGPVKIEFLVLDENDGRSWIGLNALRGLRILN